MASFFKWIMDWLRGLFFREEMELTLVGLQNSGKTTLVNVLSSGEFDEDMIPTVGFNVRRAVKGNVTIKFWDVGGQPRFRGMWERYCRGVDAIIYVVDAADKNQLPTSKIEFETLLDKPQIENIPILFLGNKNDLPGSLTAEELIEQFELSSIKDREICVYSISAKNGTNMDIVLQWLLKHTKSKQTKQRRHQ